MKKILALAVILGVSGLVIGCGGSTPAPKAPKADMGKAAADAPKPEDKPAEKAEPKAEDEKMEAEAPAEGDTPAEPAAPTEEKKEETEKEEKSE
ncbi:MAG TPA: hypothetical protein VHB77_21050 [Planctomycetaceae bacterium]|nr:hypothetical protein [Planctomycetaceae bacterium]